jgi:hypothetical protein
MTHSTPAPTLAPGDVVRHREAGWLATVSRAPAPNAPALVVYQTREQVAAFHIDWTEFQVKHATPNGRTGAWAYVAEDFDKVCPA